MNDNEEIPSVESIVSRPPRPPPPLVDIRLNDSLPPEPQPPPTRRPSKRTIFGRLLGLSTPQLSSIDECDRMPSVVRVTAFDLLCYGFSMCTFIADMGLDLAVGIGHCLHGRTVAAILTLAFVGIPSLLLNLISVLWWTDDRMRRQNDEHDSTTAASREERRIEKDFLRKVRGKTKVMEVTDADLREKSEAHEMAWWMGAAVLQIAPLAWYWKAIRCAHLCISIQKLPRRERLHFHGVYIQMIEAERDASVLRFFESLLEAMPQLLIQGYFLMADLERLGGAADWQLRTVSISMSLLSIAFAFMSHHRALRICRPEKENLQPLECNLIMVWRFFTLLGRHLFLTVGLFYYPLYVGLTLAVHLVVSLLHISILQSVETGSRFGVLDRLMIVINGFIHVFAPFNMSEGRSRLRYMIGYVVEAVEAALIYYWLVFGDFNWLFPYVMHLLMAAALAYVIGLFVMSVYFAYAHPTLHLREVTDKVMIRMGSGRRVVVAG